MKTEWVRLMALMRGTLSRGGRVGGKVGRVGVEVGS